MAVNLVEFPLTVSQWNKSVLYSTDVIVGRNGQEVRNAMWQDPLLKFNAGFAVRSYGDIATLTNFFHAMKGREQAFLVKDWADYKIDEWTTPIESGSVSSIQLVKKYTQTIGGSSSTYVRTIKNPKASALTIEFYSGSPGSWSAISGATYSTSTGIVTLGGTYATANIRFKLSEFYVPCRFDTDELPIEMMSYWVQSGADKSNVNVPEIPMIEVRLS